MAIASAGYAGTVNDLQWAQLSRYFGLNYGVKSQADLVCTQSGSTKTFNLSTGELYGRGILDVSGTIVNVAPTVPGAGGQWFLIVAHRVWATGITTIIPKAGATTSTAVPTTPPAAYPVLDANPGVLDDQPLKWVWVNASNTSVAIFDVATYAAAGRGMVTDLDSLVGRVGTDGQILHVDELNADVIYTDSAWVQVDAATFASTAARDSAYAKASGAFRAAARALVVGVVYVWNGTAWTMELPRCALLRTTNQALSAGGAAAVSWDTELSDLGGMHDAANPTRLTATLPGVYEVALNMYSGNTTGIGVLFLRRNGATDVPSSFNRREGSTAGLPMALVVPVVMGVGDYLEAIVTLSVAGSVVGSPTNQQGTIVSMRYLGPA